jgi:hypothetical protein
MHLAVNGHPLHSRALSVTITQGEGGHFDVASYLLDLRKRGVVPVAGDLQPAGVIHHMQLSAVVDPQTKALSRISAAQPAVAFEASATTEGESCRDLIGRVVALDGVEVGAGYPRRLSAEIGGPRGCSHIFTLAHLLGSTIDTALDRMNKSTDTVYRVGERRFRRDVVIDGHETEAGPLELALQLTDLYYAPAAERVRPMDRFGEQLEIRALATIDVGQFILTSIAAAQRTRTLADLEHAEWQDRADVVSDLPGLSLFAGVSRELVGRFAEGPSDRPLLDALLMLSPALIQCAGALNEGWPAEAKRSRSRIGTSGLTDSCYMWRREGALGRSIQQEMDEGLLRPRRKQRESSTEKG